ncbi:ribosomal L1 domain-containing protein 1 [Rana temporaria]|uniref:ribosomal L1 domain-containing protein 1 n=1 Tax=Rana temporaria TaxID=8407 RepID=UPI001AAD59A1|nr:ribosomal L1 domain-containing protein 1 [Rana temporaria]
MLCYTRVESNTGDRRRHNMDIVQVAKAVEVLLAYNKSKENVNKLLLNEEYDWISLMVTVWRIPKHLQTIRIPLPHGVRPDACEVCLFTRDEPNMTVEQTENFYKKMLAQHGITQITKVIPLKKMKKEYKPYEAKQRLLGSFDLFLADARIRRLLPSHIGKHFYKEKREPQSVNLKAKHLASELNRFIQGTQLHINNRGCCYTIRMGHTGMKVEDIVENTLAVAKVLDEKLPMKWKNIKVLHLKTQTSVALPIYNSPNNLKKIDSTKTMDHNKVQARKTPGDVESAIKIQEPGLMELAKKQQMIDKAEEDLKVPSRNKQAHSTKRGIEDGESQESALNHHILKKTAIKSAIKLSKSVRKVPLTKNLNKKN